MAWEQQQVLFKVDGGARPCEKFRKPALTLNRDYHPLNRLNSLYLAHLTPALSPPEHQRRASYLETKKRPRRGEPGPYAGL